VVKPIWKCKLHEARTQADYLKAKVAADFVDVFGVEADGSDEAKRKAFKWLLDRGHAVRAINVSATEERTLVAYVGAGSVRAARNRGAAPT
jgi:hypothetical protein